MYDVDDIVEVEKVVFDNGKLYINEGFDLRSLGNGRSLEREIVVILIVGVNLGVGLVRKLFLNRNMFFKKG